MIRFGRLGIQSAEEAQPLTSIFRDNEPNLHQHVLDTISSVGSMIQLLDQAKRHNRIVVKRDRRALGNS